MLFDTHAHYDAQQFDADRDALLSSMPSLGVELIMNPGCDLPSSRSAVALAEKYPFLYAAVGYHPENCAPYEKSHIEELRQMARHPKVKAIGEIGLDYYWPENPPKALQAEVFRAQMALAEELDLPVIIHEREAHADSLAIVKEFPRVRGVFHCYSGSAEFAREVLKCGYMISFTGVVTFKNARRAAEAVEVIPLDRLMIETDAPYMAPVPHRGKRCQSDYTFFMAQKIAEIKGLTTEEVISATTENGKRFFRIP